MNTIQIAIIGILIPFLGTTIGAAFVFLLKNKMGTFVNKSLLGFASGVMIAASIWSLLIPAINMAEKQGKVSWIPPTIGFLIGIVFLMYVDKKAEKLEDKASNNKKKSNKMLLLAVTLHNIPEGMAVRCSFCRIINRKCRYNSCRSNCTIYRYSSTKYTRRCNNFHAT